jgi:deoxycytidine triphosphate deaminase
MPTLSDRSIRELCKDHKMIYPCDDDNIKSASYDLSIGDEFRFSHEGDISELSDWKTKIVIPPYTICYVLTKETLNLPTDVMATIYPTMSISREGLLMYPQAPIDPGYKGKLYILLHNLTSDYKCKERGDRIASLVFFKLEGNSERPYGYNKSDKYQSAYNLNKLGLGRYNFKFYTSALKEISDTMKQNRDELLSKWIPFTVTGITAVLTIITVAAAIITLILALDQGRLGK